VYFFPGWSDRLNDNNFTIYYRMTTFLPAEKGMTIRQPSTANLMLDSADRTAGSASDFSIIRPQALLNGFFTRIATAEVVLEWNQPNVSDNSYYGLNLFAQYDDGAGGNQERIDVANGNYTVAELINYLQVQLNSYKSTFDVSWNVVPAPGGGANFFPVATGAAVSGNLSGPLILLLFGEGTLAYNTGTFFGATVPNVDLRPLRYIDFVSQQLTYNQDLKDAATNSNNRDVLCRWYFADEGPTAIDEYGYAILQGYKPFVQRRLFNPPKQIRWDNIQPLGNLSFALYNPAGQNLNLPALPTESLTNWLMTLQVSEV
jgi:hypothetical protein